MTIVADPPAPVDTLEVTLGIDTHADTHVAAVIDPLGRHLGHATFETTLSGFKALLAWAAGFGTIALAGVEGTGAYGAGLTRFLTTETVPVVEVDRPDRKTRRDQGKSDPIDAYAAARAAASGRASGTPKARTGDVESVRALRVARNSAVKARATALTQLKSLIVTAPDTLRAQLVDLDGAELVTTCARLRPARSPNPTPPPSTKRAPRPGPLADPTAATKRSLASIATRIKTLSTEITELDDDLDALITPLAPNLLGLLGVGLDVAGQLLVTAGDNPDRIHNESAFAHLCGVAPIPATSGKTVNRHRLNRGGDRAANAALYRIAICRLRWDPDTRAYVERRTKEGLSKKDIIRCLKRFIAREVLAAIRTDLNPRNPA
ncbi:MAG: IS110 family transposase [Candidatus Microthrix sp.]|jgi:transposase|nr:IS110 family transposase [Candidatus Microthrix sp.]MBK9560630.1 IS110 family transposase [Candidatus Microthrix sp.]